MTLWLALGIGALGGAGAVARVLAAAAIERRAAAAPIPLGLLAVNLAGTFALGALAGAAVEGDAMRLLATGLLGSLTTFSAWMLQSREIALAGRPLAAAANLALPLGLGLLSVWAGSELGAVLA